MNAETIITNVSKFAGYNDATKLFRDWTTYSAFPRSYLPATPTHATTLYEDNITKYKSGINFKALRNGWVKQAGGKEHDVIMDPLDALNSSSKREAELPPVQPPKFVCGTSPIKRLSPQPQDADSVSSSSSPDTPFAVHRVVYNDDASSSIHRDEASSSELPPITIDMTDPDKTMFNLITQLYWRDVDDGIMTMSAFNRFSNNILQTMYNEMLKLSADLERSIKSQSGILSGLDTETTFNILFHIISKGYAFYVQAMVDADFVSYLHDQYQPLYSMMRKKLKIT
jgi:hypothetical protein